MRIHSVHFRNENHSPGPEGQTDYAGFHTSPGSGDPPYLSLFEFIRAVIEVGSAISDGELGAGGWREAWSN